MLTRRCHQRVFAIRPSAVTNQIFEYCLALASLSSGILLHAVVMMSNHLHLVFTDVEGRFPEFTREFHRLTAKAINASQARSDSLWSASERSRLLELPDEERLLSAIAYVVANPVSAGLVATPTEWPGVLHAPRDDPYSVRVARPDAYFGARSRAPAEIELRIVPPPRIVGIAERVGGLVSNLVAKARATLRAQSRRFIGRAAVLATSLDDRPRSVELTNHLVPTVAAATRELRREVLGAHREFRRAYLAARERWRRGERDAVFPRGTWWMRIFHHVTLDGEEPATLAASAA